MKITLTLSDPEVLLGALLEKGLLSEHEDLIVGLCAVPCDENGFMTFGGGKREDHLWAFGRNPLHTSRIALPSRLELVPIQVELRPKRNGDTLPRPTSPGGTVSLAGMIASLSTDGETLSLSAPSGLDYVSGCPDIVKMVR
jgi:hypothetical protein